MAQPTTLNNKSHVALFSNGSLQKEGCSKCCERATRIWLKEHFGTVPNVVIKRKDSPKRLIERLATDCCKTLTASNWFTVAKVCYKGKGVGYFEETMDYLQKGLRQDPYHESLLQLKDEVSSVIQEESEEVVLSSEDSTKQKKSVSSNPLSKVLASRPSDSNTTDSSIEKPFKKALSAKSSASDKSKETAANESTKLKENNKKEGLIYKNVLNEKNPIRQMSKATNALSMMKKLGTDNNPLRLYYTAELREILEIKDPLKYERSADYIEKFFGCADQEFYQEHPDIYLLSNQLMLKICLNLIYRFSGSDMDKVIDYSKKLKQHVELVSKQPQIEENEGLKALAEELTLDVDFLPIKALMVKMHKEEEVNKELLLTKFIKFFPEDFHKIDDKEVLLNAGIIFYEQSKKSEEKIIKEKYLDKAFILFKAVLEKDPDNSDFLLIITQVLINLIEITEDVNKKATYEKAFKNFAHRALQCEISSESENSKRDNLLNFSKIKIPFLTHSESKKKELKETSSKPSEKDFTDSCKFYQNALKMKGKGRVNMLKNSARCGEAYFKTQTEVEKKKKITIHLIVVYQMLSKLKGGLYTNALASLIYESLEVDLNDTRTYCLGAEIYCTNKKFLEEDVRMVSLEKAAKLITNARMLCTPEYQKKNPDIVVRIKQLNQKIAKALFEP